jgi:hypothetical protein
MWGLVSPKNLAENVGDKRQYRNPVTGSECTTTLEIIDKEGNKWFSFDNLFTLPFMRQFAATKISSLYQVGLSKDDVTQHVQNLKVTLQSNDTLKYEKAMAYVLDFEEKFNDATNAVKQISSLVCVYNVMNDERIDLFDLSVQDYKLKMIEADPELHTFFLKRQIERTETYGRALDLFSKTVSGITKETLALTDLK